MGIFLFEAQRSHSATGQQGWLDLIEGYFCGFLHNVSTLIPPNAALPDIEMLIQGNRTAGTSACQRTRLTQSTANKDIHNEAPDGSNTPPAARHGRDRESPAPYRYSHQNRSTTILDTCTWGAEPAPSRNCAKNRRKRHALLQDIAPG